MYKFERFWTLVVKTSQFQWGKARSLSEIRIARGEKMLLRTRLGETLHDFWQKPGATFGDRAISNGR
jgi:hypothetical protein